jgi:hypothetical protein
MQFLDFYNGSVSRVDRDDHHGSNAGPPMIERLEVYRAC